MKPRLLVAVVSMGALLATAGAAPGVTDSAASRATEASAAYTHGRYAQAVRAYEGIARSEGTSAALYYDLGAAQLSAGQVGPAVLSFERAQWLAPRDAGIRDGLAKARAAAGLPEPAEPWWRRARAVASVDEWTLVAGLLLVVTCTGATTALLSPRGLLLRRSVRRAVEATMLGAGVALVVAALACASFVSDRSRAIVTTPSLTLRVAPFDAAAVRATLRTGEVVHLGERHGEFVRADAEDGRSGWVPRSDVGLVAGA